MPKICSFFVCLFYLFVCCCCCLFLCFCVCLFVFCIFLFYLLCCVKASVRKRAFLCYAVRTQCSERCCCPTCGDVYFFKGSWASGGRGGGGGGGEAGGGEGWRRGDGGRQ